MHDLAIELNAAIRAANPHVHEMLSHRGRELYFPKGILSQSAEAKAKAHRFNATIGMATEHGHAMFLPSVMAPLSGLTPDEALLYAPALGLPALRRAWREKQLAENPAQRDKAATLPIVTSGLTHGLSLVGDLFIDPGDVILLPDKLWGNYRLIFGTRLGAQLALFRFFDDAGRFNVADFQHRLTELSREHPKVVVLLNFPNNPVGYTPTRDEAQALAGALVETARARVNVLLVCDDAYFGLCYDEQALNESLFGLVAGADPRLLAVKLDAATKEFYVWGLRIGFLTFGLSGAAADSPLADALEKKCAGAIRGCLSNCSALGQALLLRAMQSPNLAQERRGKYEVLRRRAQRVREVLAKPDYTEAWEAYPFNSGYFMCLRLKGVDAEALRRHMLDAFGIGVISLGAEDIRVAFSCLEEDQIEALFDALREGVLALRGAAAK